MALDLLNREIKIGDYVVSYNNLYVVLKTSERYVLIVLVKPSKTTRPLSKPSWQTVLVDSAAVNLMLKLE